MFDFFKYCITLCWTAKFAANNIFLKSIKIVNNPAIKPICQESQRTALFFDNHSNISSLIFRDQCDSGQRLQKSFLYMILHNFSTFWFFLFTFIVNFAFEFSSRSFSLFSEFNLFFLLRSEHWLSSACEYKIILYFIFQDCVTQRRFCSFNFFLSRRCVKYFYVIIINKFSIVLCDKQIN